METEGPCGAPGHRSLFVPCFLQARLHPLGPFLSQKGRFKQLLIKRGQPRNPLNEWTFRCCCCSVAQLYPTLCDPMGCSLPGSSVQGILQARILKWLPFPSPGVLPNLGITPWCPALQADSKLSEPPGKPKKPAVQFSSVAVQFRVMSDSFQPYETQHARPPCPSPTPGVHPNPCPLSQWCHPTISSFVVPFSSHLQSFSASESFQISQLFAWGGQSIGVSASTSVLPMNTQDWSPLEWTDWISLQSKGLSRVFSNTTVQKHQFFCPHLSL